MALTRRKFASFALAFSGGLKHRLTAQNATPVRYLSFEDVRPALAAFSNGPYSAELPPELKTRTAAPADWTAWIAQRDRSIRARLREGDADSVANFALLGTSFTSQPRLTGAQMESVHGDDEVISRWILGRVQDLMRALARPAANERLQFVADWLKEKGADPSLPGKAERAGNTLLDAVLRELHELEEYEKAIAQAKRSGEAAAQRAGSTLYRNRGLALDTSFRPNLGIEQVLAGLKSHGLVTTIRRAGVFGPGLDFTDKRNGYDYYPVQTLQPFALIDSLRRVGIAGSDGPSVAIFDLSARVLNHVRRAVDRAAAGDAYVVQTPLDDDVPWFPNAKQYWSRFGSEIGTEAPAVKPPPGLAVKARAVRIRPEVVKLLRPVDLNMVCQQEALADSEKLDLAIATNVLVYYGVFEQTLSMLNIARMLKPGGVLLCNNSLPQTDGAPLRLAESASGRYSSLPDDSDQFFCYRR